MKKTIFSVAAVVVSIVCIACGIVFGINNKPDKTFSDTNNLTLMVDDDMSRTDIASLYINACVSVYVETEGVGYSLGSGTCVASKGYTTSSGFKAERGAYFATNYHVISNMVEKDFEGFNSKAYIVLNGQSVDNGYECKLVWHDKDVDMALLYCDENLIAVNQDFGWISMQDRSIACEQDKQLLFDEIFTIGTPLNMEFQNTLSLGYVSNQRPKESFTTSELYVVDEKDGYRFTTNEHDIPSRQTLYYYEVLNNAYQDLIMINLDITNGNSGGAVFDKNGYIVGLATLGIGYELANTSSLNFAVPIYPITLVLDNVIEENENGETNNVIKISDLGLFGVDSAEVSYMTDLGVIKETPMQSYYIDGNFVYANLYPNAFAFDGNGYIVLETKENGLVKDIDKEFVITSISKGEHNTNIQDRNDLIYFLYSCKKDDEISLNGYYLNDKTKEKSYKITL